MVERRSIIFSKLLEGRALSAAAEAAAAAEAVAAATAAAGGGAGGGGPGGGGPAPGGFSPLTDGVPPAGGAAAEAPPVLAAPAELLGTGGSDALGVELLLSEEGWGWDWFCCCPGTW